MPSRLEVFPEDHTEPNEVPLGKLTTIGRCPESQIRIADNPEVAFYHAEIERIEPDTYRLNDLGSLNGTFVDGERLQAPHQLQDRDRIRVGNTRMIFHQGTDDAETDTEASAAVKESAEARLAARLRSTEQLFRTLSDNVTDLMSIIDENGRRVWTNDAYYKVLGYESGELSGTYSMGDIHEEDRRKVQEVFAESMKSGQGRPLEYRMRHRDGHWVHLESKATIVDNWDGHTRCMVVVARDVTLRKQAEAEKKAQTDRLLKQATALGELSHAPEIREGDLEGAARRLTRTAARTLGCSRAAVWFWDRSAGELRCDDLYDVRRDSHQSGKTLPLEEKAPMMERLCEERTLASPDAYHDSRLEEWLGCYLQPDHVGALLLVPIRTGEDLLGLLTLEHEEVGRQWFIDEENFAASLTDFALLTLQTRDRIAAYQALEASQALLANEVAQAAEYVRSLLPSKLQGQVATDWRYVPSSQLGGDCFGYHWIDEDRLAIYLLDVVDHGVGPALLSVSVLNMLRSQALAGTDYADPGGVLTALNRTFQMQDQNDMYFTIWYGVYDRRNHEIHFASAGHPPAVLFSGRDGSWQRRELHCNGVIIGAVPDAAYSSARAGLEERNHLFVFSDGLYEVSMGEGKEFALPEFMHLLEANMVETEADLDDLLKRVRDLQGSDQFDDDLSVMTLAIRPPST